MKKYQDVIEEKRLILGQEWILFFVKTTLAAASTVFYFLSCTKCGNSFLALLMVIITFYSVVFILWEIAGLATKAIHRAEGDWIVT